MRMLKKLLFLFLLMGIPILGKAQNHSVPIIGNKFTIYSNQTTNSMNSDFVGGIARYFLNPIPPNTMMVLEFNNNGVSDVANTHSSGPFTISCTTDPTQTNPNGGSSLANQAYSWTANNIPFSTNTAIVSFANGSFVQTQTATITIPAISNQSSTFVISAPLPCATITLNFGSVWSTANNLASITVSGIFVPTAPSPTIFGNTNLLTSFNHITGTTAVSVKGFPGSLYTLSVNTGAAGTVSIFDLNAASCTGTPSTNTIAVITATTTTTQTFTYNVQFVNGLCIKESVAMDITASYQ